MTTPTTISYSTPVTDPLISWLDQIDTVKTPLRVVHRHVAYGPNDDEQSGLGPEVRDADDEVWPPMSMLDRGYSKAADAKAIAALPYLLSVVRAAANAATPCNLSVPATSSKIRRSWCITHQEWHTETSPCSHFALAASLDALSTFVEESP